MHAASGDSTVISRPPTSRLSRSQSAADGHSGSPGRMREKEGSAAAATACGHLSQLLGRRGSAAPACSRRLLFMMLPPVGVLLIALLLNEIPVPGEFVRSFLDRAHAGGDAVCL